MTRHNIGFTSRGPAVFRNVKKATSGEPLILLDENEAKDVELDLTGYLETGETISSATITAEGVTATVSTSSPTVTLSLSAATKYDLSGKVEVVITMSTGEVWRGYIRVRRRSRYMTSEYDSLSDYS